MMWTMSRSSVRFLYISRTSPPLCLPCSSWTVSQISAADLCTVVVMYASAYGNTAALAQALSRGITKAGVGVETLNLVQCRCVERMWVGSHLDSYLLP